MGLWWLTKSWICLSELFLVLDCNLFKSRKLFLFCEIITLWFPFRNQVFTAIYRFFFLFHRPEWSPLWNRNYINSFVQFLFKRIILFVEASLLYWFVTYCHLLWLLFRWCCYQWTKTWKCFALYDSALVRWAEIFFHRAFLDYFNNVKNNKKTTRPEIKIKSEPAHFLSSLLLFFLAFTLSNKKTHLGHSNVA